jgi:hypothetical protein
MHAPAEQARPTPHVVVRWYALPPALQVQTSVPRHSVVPGVQARATHAPDTQL